MAFPAPSKSNRVQNQRLLLLAKLVFGQVVWTVSAWRRLVMLFYSCSICLVWCSEVHFAILALSLCTPPALLCKLQWIATVPRTETLWILNASSSQPWQNFRILVQFHCFFQITVLQYHMIHNFTILMKNLMNKCFINAAPLCYRTETSLLAKVHPRVQGFVTLYFIRYRLMFLYCFPNTPHQRI